MRISDWSSDVCSSDLEPAKPVIGRQADIGRNVERGCGGRPAVLGQGRIGQRGRCKAQRHGRNHPVQTDIPFVLGNPADYSTAARSEEHTSELQSLMRISYAVFCLKKKNQKPNTYTTLTKTRMKLIVI